MNPHELRRRLIAEAACCCDPDIAELLTMAADMLRGFAGKVCPVCEVREVQTNGKCKTCYQRIWRQTMWAAQGKRIRPKARAKTQAALDAAKEATCK